MTAKELEKLLAEVTPGEWVDDFDDGYLGQTTDDYGFENPQQHIVRVDEIILAECDNIANARLIAMAPTLARRVIAAEKLVKALEWVKFNGGYAHRENIMAVATDALAEWESAQ